MQSVFSYNSYEEWVPADYLQEYYGIVELEEKYLLEFLVSEARKIKNQPVMLDFGSGPVVSHLFPFTPYVSEIHVADYLDLNLNEIRKWQHADKNAYDWRPFAEFVLTCEGILSPSKQDIQLRETLTRQKITQYLNADATLANPLKNPPFRKYDVIVTCYCIDGISGDKKEWARYMGNLVSLLNPGGFLIISIVTDCYYCRSGDKYFPCPNISDQDILDLFTTLGFDKKSLTIQQIRELPDRNVGYESFTMLSGYF